MVDDVQAHGHRFPSYPAFHLVFKVLHRQHTILAMIPVRPYLHPMVNIFFIALRKGAVHNDCSRRYQVAE